MPLLVSANGTVQAQIGTEVEIAVVNKRSYYFLMLDISNMDVNTLFDKVTVYCNIRIAPGGPLIRHKESTFNFARFKSGLTLMPAANLYGLSYSILQVTGDVAKTFDWTIAEDANLYYQGNNR